MSERRGSRRKQKRGGLIFKLFLFLLFICLLLSGLAGMRSAGWFSSGEKKDLNEWFEVEGEETKIYLDGNVERNYLGISRGGEIFLPIEYVHENLNRHFYYSASDDMLSITLPDGTLDFTESDSPSFIKTAEGAGTDVADRKGAGTGGAAEGVSISLDLIRRFTDISYESFADDTEPAKRVFIYHGGFKTRRAAAAKRTSVRSGQDRKAPVLTEAAKGDGLIVSDYGENWSRVITADGLSGYIETGALEDTTDYVFPENGGVPDFTRAVPVDSGKKVVMSWLPVYNMDGNAAFDSVLSGAGGVLTAVSPTWLQIADADGGYLDFTDASLIEKAHNAGIEVWPAIDNFNQPGGLNDFNTGEFFESAVRRRGFIERLIGDAVRYGYDGLNLDFEGLSRDSGESFTQFFRELSAACGQNGLKLSIDNYVPYGFNDFYNIDEQAVYADYVVVMAYDEYTSSPGPVASMDYTEYAIDKTLTMADPSRVIGAMPLYSRIWITDEDGADSSKVYGFDSAAAAALDLGLDLSRDAGSGLLYGEKNENGQLVRAWIEDGESLKMKMDLMRSRDIGGVAFWRLGYDTPELWETLDFNSAD